MKHSWFISIFLFLALTCWSSADTLYGEDLAWRLANPKEIKRVTTIKARLRRESKEADPLFILTPPPFDDIPTAPDKSRSGNASAKSWQVPPWPTVDPALPDQDPRERNLEPEPSSSVGVWSEVDPIGGNNRAPSILLRPRSISPEERLVFRPKEIPEPFSLRRYYDRHDVFIEIAAYGGTTSFKAEEAYRALKEAATGRQDLEGIGTSAFLTRLEIVEEIESEDDKQPFSDLPVRGDSRPDLMDSGQAAALLAPAFQELAVKDLEGRTIKYLDPNKRYRSQDPKVLGTLLAIVAFYPDRALTVSVIIEERLGGVQDLVAIAMLTQKKLKNEIRPN